MKFENALPEELARRMETEIGRSKPLKIPATAFGKKTQVEFWWARQHGDGFDIRVYRGGRPCA